MTQELSDAVREAVHELSYREFWDCIEELDYLEGTWLNVAGWWIRERVADRELSHRRRTHE